MGDADSSNEIEALAGSLVTAKEEVDKAKAALKKAEDAYAEIEGKVAIAMQGAGTDQLKAEGRFVTLKVTERWAIAKAHVTDAVALFKEHEPTLVKESVHAATLTKFAKEMSGQDSPPAWWAQAEGMLDKKSSSEVRVTKTKPKK